MKNENPKLFVTLWPDFPHFPDFAQMESLAGIRMNSAAMIGAEIDSALQILEDVKPTVPCWFDIKARQLRIEQVNFNENYLDIVLNHPVRVRTPVPVLFKGGEDNALLLRIEEKGRRLIFQPGAPKWVVHPGDSIHILDPSLQIGKPLFTEKELIKIEKVTKFGIKKYFLSYVGSRYEVDQLVELVGSDSELYLKIEDKKGLEFIANDFKKTDNIRLAAACGDLFVEVDQPHHIIDACKLIIEKDPDALVGSRMLLSIIKKEGLEGEKPKITCNPIPSFADFAQLAWLRDIGYKTFMLCDELCLQEELLKIATRAFFAASE